MNCYSDVSDKTIKVQSKSKHLQNCTQNEFENCLQIKHTIENPEFFDIDEIFNCYITNHNKKFHLYLAKGDFKLVLDGEFSPPNKSELRFIRSKFPLGKVLLLWIEYFIERVQKVSHIYGMNITTVGTKKDVSFDVCIKQPIRMI